MVADYYPYLLEACRENVLPLTSRCNLGCVFCSNKQNPAQIFTYKLPALPQTTIRQLIPLLNPQEKVIIGESATKLDEGEPFTHPEILSVLKMLRAALPKTMLAITTNGTLLTEKVIRELAALTPLELTVSLNSATPQGRRILMHDEAPNRALQAVDGLARHDLPFHGSLVAMPHLVGFEDIKETVFFLARHGALTIRIFLPGYTKFAPEKLKFPLQLWEQIVFYAQEWSNLLDLPVIPEPLIPDNLEPCIWGVIPDSPAKRAGLQADDLIKEVDGRVVRTRVEAFMVAKSAHNPNLTLTRKSQELSLQLKKERGQSPGFVVLYDFDPRRAVQVQAQIRRHQAIKPLLLTSEFGTVMVQKVLQHYAIQAEVKTVLNCLFGGSIRAAGLLSVDDFHRAAKAALSQKAYDLLLVPREAFDHRGRDLTGQSVDSLAAALKVPVALV